MQETVCEIAKTDRTYDEACEKKNANAIINIKMNFIHNIRSVFS